MSQVLAGYGAYLVSLLTLGGIYAVLALGLNIQWGYAGMFNAGVSGFFARAPTRRRPSRPTARAAERAGSAGPSGSASPPP